MQAAKKTKHLVLVQHEAAEEQRRHDGETAGGVGGGIGGSRRPDHHRHCRRRDVGPHQDDCARATQHEREVQCFREPRR